ncbi:uncharacterized protein G2W53_024311 [Senna tora]|uniref:Uncharacterized protein n=1 Tax=Senna tora TaxID=362788 RepID=A0A834WGU1_9FABA|nr:uncharacterized protein G2W53_024311 [Senna tora]
MEWSSYLKSRQVRSVLQIVAKRQERLTWNEYEVVEGNRCNDEPALWPHGPALKRSTTPFTTIL